MYYWVLQQHLQSIRDVAATAAAGVRFDLDDSIQELDELLAQPIEGLSRRETVEQFEGESMMKFAAQMGVSLT